MDRNTGEEKDSTRREFFRGIVRYLFLAVLGVAGGWLWIARRHGRAMTGCRVGTDCKECGLSEFCGAVAASAEKETLVWQLDPGKCIQCGRCATHCVLNPSAVKCVHAYSRCGYCKLCFGYFRPNADQLNENAENQLCPTGAIQRTFVEDPYYEYRIDDALCIGCGKCVKGCAAFGNGSLFLQVNHDLCVNCNECSIAVACPANAFRRVPAESPYILKPGMKLPSVAMKTRSIETGESRS